MKVQDSLRLLRWGIALTALGTAPVAMGQAAGQMLFVKGDVQIVGTDGARRPARQGEAIQEGERVVTGPGAMGQVKLADGGFVGVRPDSGVHFEPRKGGGPRSMELTAGKVRVLNVDGGKGVSPYVVRTPHGELRMGEADALAGILPVAPGDDGTVRTVLKLNRGTGTAVDKAGTPLEMAGGEAVSVRPGRPTPQRVAAVTVPGLTNTVLPGDGVSAAGQTPAPRNPSTAPLPRLPSPIRPVIAGQRSPVVLGFRPDGINSIAKATGSGAPGPTRVIDPNVLTAVTTGRLPRISFTKDSSSTLNDGVRGIVAAGTGSSTTVTSLREPTISTLSGTKILAPTTTGSLTGTLTGTRTLTTTTTLKTGTITLRP